MSSAINITLMFLFLVSYSLGAQNRSAVRDSQCAFVNALRQGVILVRLPDQNKTLKMLEEQGRQAEAEQIRAEVLEERKETMLSFRQTFDFCPVYFFNARNSEKIRRGEYKGAVFNEKGDFIEPLNWGEVFIAEFSETQNLGIDGLILMNDKLLPFEEPLPYYERRYVLLGLISRSKARMAEKFNKSLYDFLKYKCAP